MTLPRCDSVAALYALQNSMMLTPCWPSAGPTGGAGVAAPALIWSLMTAVNRFLGGMTTFFSADQGSAGALRSDLGDLGERQLDRRLAAEDGDEHLELLLLGVDLVDGGRQRGERAVHDGDGLAHLELHDRSRARGRRRLGSRGGLGRGGRHEEVHHLVDAQRRGLG